MARSTIRRQRCVHRRSTQLEANQHLQERGLQEGTSRIQGRFALLPTLDHVTGGLRGNFRGVVANERCEERFTLAAFLISAREC